MARRATFIKTLRDAPTLKNKLLVLGCPFEILPDGPEAKPGLSKVPPIVKALDMIGYDAGALTPEEADYIRKGDAPLPEHFAVTGPTPQSRLIQAGDIAVGLVFFPASPNLAAPVPTALGDAVAEEAAALRGKVKLVIGISGWGMSGEEAFMNAHPGAVDVLLGSGPNAGMAGRPAGNGRTLWARSYIKGKTVNRLDLMRLPEGNAFTWKTDEAFKASVTSLDDTFPSDAAIQKLFE